MRYCLNPLCREPQNTDHDTVCRTCGTPLRWRDRYYAIQPLGKGGVGRTFLAVDEGATIACVIQQRVPQGRRYDERAIALFRQELQRLRELGSHPQIPALIEAVEQAGVFYLVQDWINGPTLETELQENGPFSEAQIWQVLREMLPVLRWIHAHQMIHRDIKPDNIIRRANPGHGELVLVDFGAAKVVTALDPIQTEPQIGSAEYVAPEQVRGHAIYASDLYSLGVTCIHLLTQQSPFELFDPGADRWVWTDYLVQPVSEELIDLLNRLIAPAIAHRFPSADAAIATLPFPTPSRSPSPISPAPPPTQLSGHTSTINDLALHPDQPLLASASDDKTIRLWDLTTHQAIAHFSHHTHSVRTVAFSPDGARLASAGDDRTIQIWDWQTGQILAVLEGHRASVRSLQFSSDGRWLASGSWDKTVRLWSLATHEIVATLTAHSLQVTAIAISANAQWLASASFDRTVHLWRLEQTESSIQPHPHQHLTDHVRAVTALAFSPDQSLATGSDDNTIKLWCARTGTLLQTLKGHSWTIAALAFSRDGRTLFSGSWDATVRWWDVATGDELGCLSCLSNPIQAIAISQIAGETGDRILAGGRDGIIYGWNSIMAQSPNYPG